MANSNEEKIQGYQQGAADSRKYQLEMEEVGRPDLAACHAEAVDANLDAINQLKTQTGEQR